MCIYISKIKKNVKIVNKLMFFFSLDVKCFLKKVWKAPSFFFYWKYAPFFHILNDVYDAFSVLFFSKSSFSIIMDSINMTNSPGLVSESCHESTFKLIRHHNFHDVLWTVRATWTFNKYNNIEWKVTNINRILGFSV